MGSMLVTDFRAFQSALNSTSALSTLFLQHSFRRIATEHPRASRNVPRYANFPRLYFIYLHEM